jgi:hypothetical protein
MRSFIGAMIVCMAAGLPAAAQQPPASSSQQPPPGPTPQQPSVQTPQQPPPATGQPSTPTDPRAPDAPPTPPPQNTRMFTGDAGLIFFPVKPDKTADFEKIVAKLKEALQTSEDPVRQEQATGWKVFKAAEPGPNNTALYLFLLDPAVKGSDYAFWKAMYEAFPAEVQQLYRLYNAASAGGQSLLNLQLVESFGAAPLNNPRGPATHGVTEGYQAFLDGLVAFVCCVVK